MTTSAPPSDIVAIPPGRGGSTEYVHRHLGEKTIADKLCSRGSGGLPHSLHVPASSSSSFGLILHNSHEQSPCRIGERRSESYAVKRSNRRGSSFPGLLLPSLCSTEKRRGMAAGDKSQTYQQGVSRTTPLPDGHLQGRRHPPSSGGLGSVGGFERRLLSHPPSSSVSSLSPIRLAEKTLPIPCPALRPIDSPIHFHNDHEAHRRLSPSSGHQDHLLPRRSVDHRQNKRRVRKPSPLCSRPSSTTGISHQLEEIMPYPEPTIPVSRSLLGNNSRRDLPSRRQTVETTASGETNASVCSFVSRTASPPRSHDLLNPSNPADSPSRSSAPTRSGNSLLVSTTRQTPSPSVDGFNGEPSMDSLFGASPLSSPDVASDGRTLRSRSLNRRLEPGLGHTFSRTASPGEVGCGCPSPYQCEGINHSPYLPPGFSSFIQSSSRDSLALRQHDCHLLHKEGGRYSLSPPPPDCNGDPASSGKNASSYPSRLCSDRREPPSGCSIQVPVSPGLAPSSDSVQDDMSSMGNAADRPLRNRQLDSADSFFRLGGVPKRRSLRRPPPSLGLSVGVHFPSSATPPSSPRQNGALEGGIHPHHPLLEDAEMVSSPSGHEDSGSKAPSPTTKSGNRSNDRFTSAQTQPSSSTRLEDFRRLHASSISDESFRLVAESWRKSSSTRYDAVWRSFQDFLSSGRIPLDKVDLTIVSDYLSSLFHKGLAYRTICLHRSVLSMTLPHFDGVAVGDHPLIGRLIKGVFNQRPPSRRIYDAWDVGKAFQVFADWIPPLSMKQVQRKAAFLIAMATARRPSELSSLQCSASFMTTTVGVSKTSKTGEAVNLVFFIVEK